MYLCICVCERERQRGGGTIFCVSILKLIPTYMDQHHPLCSQEQEIFPKSSLMKSDKRKQWRPKNIQGQSK